MTSRSTNWSCRVMGMFVINSWDDLKCSCNQDQTGLVNWCWVACFYVIFVKVWRSVRGGGGLAVGLEKYGCVRQDFQIPYPLPLAILWKRYSFHSWNSEKKYPCRPHKPVASNIWPPWPSVQIHCHCQEGIGWSGQDKGNSPSVQFNYLQIEFLYCVIYPLCTNVK